MPNLASTSPLVSVVMPAHNAARYLGEALQSVRAQTYPSVEIIVIDDGSTDQTAQVARSVGDVRYFHQTQSGAGPARNFGVEKARRVRLFPRCR